MAAERVLNSELLSLEGKTAVVTGGAMGIGASIVMRFFEAGAKVVVVDMNEDRALQVFTRLGYSKKDAEAHFLRANVTDSQAVGAAVEKTVRRFGGIDILVNCAGIYPTKSIVLMTDDEWKKVLQTNLSGTFFTNRAVAREMIEQGKGGRIINIGSVCSVQPWRAGMAAYDASKAGILGFSRNLALELAPHGITVNVIGPGDIDTPGSTGGNLSLEQLANTKIPLGRRGTPDDIAKVVLTLAGPIGDYITGDCIIVDGGWLLTSSNS